MSRWTVLSCISHHLVKVMNMKPNREQWRVQTIVHNSGNRNNTSRLALNSFGFFAQMVVPFSFFCPNYLFVTPFQYFVLTLNFILILT